MRGRNGMKDAVSADRINAFAMWTHQAKKILTPGGAPIAVQKQKRKQQDTKHVRNSKSKKRT